MIHKLVDKYNTVLHTKAAPFDFTTGNASQLAIDLTETMLEHNGIGLAAPQIGISTRAFVIKSNPVIAVFNPLIVDMSTKTIELEEGCLTFPGVFFKVSRPERIKVRYKLPNGEIVTEIYSGMTARIFLHEFEHLEGEVFTKHVSKIKLEMAQKKAAKRNG